MRCSRFLHVSHEGGSGWIGKFMDRLMNALAERYRGSLEIALRIKWLIIGSSIAFFAATAALVAPIRKELIPSQDQSLFLLTLKAPVGTSIRATDGKFKLAEAELAKSPDVADVYSSIGNYQGFDIVNEGVIYVSLKDPSKRRHTQSELMRELAGRLRVLLPGVEVFGQDLSLTGFTATRGYPIEFTVQGPDWEKLSRLSNEVITRMKASKLFADVNTDYQ